MFAFVRVLVCYYHAILTDIHSIVSEATERSDLISFILEKLRNEWREDGGSFLLVRITGYVT